MVEAKQTKNVSYSLKLGDWRKIEKQAMRVGKEAAMVIEMAGRSLVVIDYNTWLGIKG